MEPEIWSNVAAVVLFPLYVYVVVRFGSAAYFTSKMYYNRWVFSSEPMEGDKT